MAMCKVPVQYMLPTGMSFSPLAALRKHPLGPCIPFFGGLLPLVLRISPSPLHPSPSLLFLFLFLILIVPNSILFCILIHSLTEQSLITLLLYPAKTALRTDREALVGFTSLGLSHHHCGKRTFSLENIYISNLPQISIRSQKSTSKNGSSDRISFSPHSGRHRHPQICPSATIFSWLSNRWITWNRCNRSSIWPSQFNPGWTDGHRPYLNPRCYCPSRP